MKAMRAFKSVMLIFVLCGIGALRGEAQAVPEKLQPPTGESLLFELRGKGDQIYVCKADGQQFAWTLKAPEAQLLDKDGKVFGKHFAGPSWEANDGSGITGKAVASASSPDLDAIPWLLLTVVDRHGQGVLARVTSIQRIHTKGGKASGSTCDAAHAGSELRVPYSADYLFFAPK